MGPMSTLRTVAISATVATLGLFGVGAAAPESRLASDRSTSAAAEYASAARRILTTDQEAAIEYVRRTTAPFHDLAAAKAAGYAAPSPDGCAGAPDAAQGYHYLNPLLVDDTVDLARPERVAYEPRPDGSLALVGVEYIVPLARWTARMPPTLFGVPFARDDALGVWSLHLWAWRPNPEGMFARWYPGVSCAPAG